MKNAVRSNFQLSRPIRRTPVEDADFRVSAADLDAIAEVFIRSRALARYAVEHGVPERDVEDALQEAAIAVLKLKERKAPFGRGLAFCAVYRAIGMYARKCQRLAIPSGTPGETHAAAATEETTSHDGIEENVTATEALARIGKGKLIATRNGWTYILGPKWHQLGPGSEEEAALAALKILAGVRK